MTADKVNSIKQRFPRLIHVGSFDPDITNGEPMFVGDFVMIRDNKAYRIKPGEKWEGWVWTGEGVYHIHDEPIWEIC